MNTPNNWEGWYFERSKRSIPIAKIHLAKDKVNDILVFLRNLVMLIFNNCDYCIERFCPTIERFDTEPCVSKRRQIRVQKIYCSSISRDLTKSYRRMDRSARLLWGAKGLYVRCKHTSTSRESPSHSECISHLSFKTTPHKKFLSMNSTDSCSQIIWWSSNFKNFTIFTLDLQISIHFFKLDCKHFAIMTNPIAEIKYYLGIYQRYDLCISLHCWLCKIHREHLRPLLSMSIQYTANSPSYHKCQYLIAINTVLSTKERLILENRETEKKIGLPTKSMTRIGLTFWCIIRHGLLQRQVGF